MSQVASVRRRRAIGRVGVVVALATVGVATSAVLPPSSLPAGGDTLLSGLALVANWGSHDVTPIDTQDNTALGTIGVGTQPDAIAITPNGAEAYVANWASNSVTPINLSTLTAGTAIAVGRHPDAVAIAPDGVWAYVANFGSSSVSVIDVAKNTVSTTVTVGAHPDALAASPSNFTVYVASETSANATEISVSDNKTFGTIAAGPDPTAVAVSPDSSMAYFVNEEADAITPTPISTGKAGTETGTDSLPRDLALSPDGTTGYVSDFGQDSIQAFSPSEGRTGAAVTVGGSPMGLAVSPDDSTVYVADSGSDQVTPVATSDLTAGAPISVGSAPDAIAVTPNWNDQAFVTWTGGQADTEDSPAFVWFDGDLYTVWTDAVSGNQLFYSYYDGSVWSAAKTISWSGGQALTNAGAAMVADGAYLYVAWKGEESGTAAVWWSALHDGTWSKQQIVNWGSGTGNEAMTDDAPALTVQIGDPMVAWTTTSDHVDISTAASPTTWTKPSEVSTTKGAVTTTYSPALTWSPTMELDVVAWTNSTDTIGFEPYGDPSEAGTVTSALTVAAPALGSTGDAIYCAWEGKTGNKVWYSGVWPDYTSWSGWVPQETEPQALTNLKPSLTANGGVLTVGWKGESSESLGFASKLTPY